MCVCVDDNETYRNTIHAKNVQKREKKKIKTEQRGFFVRTEFREWKTQQNIERERKGIQEIKEKYFRRLFFLAHLFLGCFYIYIFIIYKDRLFFRSVLALKKQRRFPTSREGV